MNLFKNIANNLPGIVYRVFVREDNRIRFFNKAAERITGYTDEDLSGGAVCGIECLILPEDRARVMEEVSGAVRENRPFTVEYRLSHRDGSVRHLLEQGTPVYGPDGGPLFIDGVIFDLTERRSAEEALAQVRRDLERSKADFSSMVNHDIKSPLTVLHHYLDVLRLREKPDREMREIIEGIERSSLKIIGMVEEFQAVFDITSGPVKIRSSEVLVGEILYEVEAQFGALAGKRGLGFEVKADGRVSALMDKKLVARAVSNLVQNAVKYTPSGGRVVLEAGRADEGHVHFSVADTGPGIPPGEQARVFEKYYRLSRDAHMKGSGLGLYIVKAVAEAHGGRAELSSEEGKGSSFRIVLPAGPEPC